MQRLRVLCIKSELDILPPSQSIPSQPIPSHDKNSFNFDRVMTRILLILIAQSTTNVFKCLLIQKAMREAKTKAVPKRPNYAAHPAARSS